MEPRQASGQNLGSHLTNKTHQWDTPPEQTKDLLVSCLISPATGQWNKEKIRDIMPFHEERVLELRPSAKGARDKTIWLHTEDGIYIAKSGYYKGLQADEDMGPALGDIEMEGTEELLLRGFDWNKQIWRLNTGQKTKLFMWKAMRNGLPVGENLRARNVNTTVRCSHCGEAETTLHLLFSCDFTIKVWNLIPCTQTIDSCLVQSVRSGIEGTKDANCLPPTGISSGPISPWVVWSIWKSRNQRIFESRRLTPEDTTTQALRNAREWQTAQIKTPARKIRSQTRPPAHPLTVTCNTDTAWNRERKTAGFGWLFSTREGVRMTHGSASENTIRSALLAEAISVHRALQHAKHLGLSHISVASDSQLLIKAINRGIPHKELHGILHDILDLACFFSKISFRYVQRESNVIDDKIAKNALVTLGLGPV
ncbi:unnamed protein product [Microthlaspi erraticum]|uniref:Uncharacterized protein n=1 Tax=Microthlaspi erraticum TaxID=1685480 RepID=A0A6D2KL85_9BRAS|nr:unnamed protein product [Microthlaspi erraticum]CAA7054007.1 unnamed protein product [Microthlaspi erraticum]